MNKIILKYAISCIAVAAVVLLRYLMVSKFGEMPLFLLALPVVMLISLILGMGPGILATFLTAALLGYFFMQPYGHVIATNVRDQVSLGIFCFIGISISIFSDIFLRYRSTVAELAERKKSEEALRESQTKYQRLVEGSGSIIMTADKDLNITFINEYGLRFFDYTAAELIGKPVLGTTIPKTDSAGHDLKAMVDDLAQHPAKYTTNVHQNMRKDGSLVWVSWTNNVIKDDKGNFAGVLAVGNDISQLKKAEDALKATAQFRRAIIDSLPANIAILDEHGTVISVNDSWLRFARENGAANTEKVAEGSNYIAVCRRAATDGDLLAAEAMSGIEDILAGRSQRFSIEYPCHSPDKQRWFVMIAVRSMPAGGSVIITHVDITERKRAEDALRESEEHYHSLFSNMLDGLAYCRMLYENGRPKDFIYLNVNKAFGKFTRLENVEGKKVIEVIPGIQNSNPELFEIYGRVAMTGESEKFETYLEQLNLWFSISVYSPRKEHFIAVFENITERKRAEEAMRQSEEQFRRAIEDAPIPVIMHAEDGQVLQISRTWTKLTNYQPEDMPTFEAWLNKAYGEGAEAVRRHMYELFRGIVQTIDIEFPIRTADGKTRYWSFSASAPGTLADGRRFVVGMAIDITDRKRAEERLIASEAKARQQQVRLQAVLDSAPVIIWIALDSKCEQVIGNRAAYSLLRMPEGSNMSLSEIFAQDATKVKLVQDGKELPLNEWPLCVAAGTGIHLADYSMDMVFTDGRSRSMLGNVVPILDAQGMPNGAIAAFMDVTERKRQTDELERLSDELEYKNEELESIIRVASHDLRSPLMNIKGFAGELIKDIGKVQDALKEVQLPETTAQQAEKVFTKYVPEAVGYIQASADSISGMIKSLMDVAKAGTVPINIDDLDMDAIFAEIAANEKFNLSEAGGTLEIEPLPKCRGDAVQITQVFTNLVENAIKYREPSRPLEIKVYAGTEADKVTYCVEDNGKGIAKEQLDTIFLLFSRLDPEAAKGEGIGLTIAKRMIERQGGRIWVRSEAGTGSKFFVTLPK